jgi:hypothetical protein
VEHPHRGSARPRRRADPRRRSPGLGEVRPHRRFSPSASCAPSGM